jgi:bifunctional UDP-N-acetylglucosamine pyrophosphorylase/glucosamine-1-phosphate N-acetyltransferase
MSDTTTTDVSTPPTVTAVVVLAAGHGTRMRSSVPKVLHPLAGRPLLWHAVRAAAGVSPQHVIAVIGHGRDQVEQYLAGVTDLPPVIRSVQQQQQGTGHAVECALQTMGRLEGTVIVTYGDVPLLRSETLLGLAAEHSRSGNAVTVLTAVVDDPTGYGRIVRDSAGGLTGIVEHRDADESVRAVREINSGVYAFDGDLLAEALGRLSSANAQGERYLTDVVRIARDSGRPVGTVQAVDPAETEGVNDRVQLAAMARRLNDRLIRAAQLAGVTVHDPATTWLHADVSIGADTEILPGTSLQSGTIVGGGCSIGPDTTLVDCVVGDGARVLRSHCHGARIGAGAAVGPFTHLRPGTVIHEHAEVGAFVEVKAATIGPGVKAHHLAYLGDATIAAGANIGAGVITANYDGLHKSATAIGEQAFIGSNATLVAPVTVADGAYVAAGSTITDAVEPGDLAVARGRQHNSPGWVLRRRPGSRSESAARAAGAQPAGTAGDQAGEGQTTP